VPCQLLQPVLPGPVSDPRVVKLTGTVALLPDVLTWLVVVVGALDQEVAALQPLERDRPRHDFVDKAVLRLGLPGTDQRVEGLEGKISIRHVRKTVAVSGTHRPPCEPYPCGVVAVFATLGCVPSRELIRRGGRAVECGGLENR
jgi:hypothetical protein